MLPTLVKKNDVFLVSLPYRKQGTQWHFMLAADLHLDSKHCNRELLQQHLQRAKDRNALVFFFGDVFDAMGAKRDRRKAFKQMLAENMVDAYFNSLIDTGERVLGPYRDNIALMTAGNHERSVTKWGDISLLPLLARQLQRDDGTCPRVGGYEGYIAFRSYFEQGGKSVGKRSTKLLYFHHGSGGGGPVTRGVIGTNRRSTYIDADIICTGHIHEAWHVITKKDYVARSLYRRQKVQHHVQLPTYKDEFAQDGYHDENQRPPKPLGCVWLTLTVVDHQGSVNVQVQHEVI